MAKLHLFNGVTGVIVRMKLRDSSTGAGKTGLTSASSGLKISTIANNENTATVYTVAGSTIETITTLGTYAAPTATKCRFKEVDATNHPGIYELQFDNDRFAVSGAKQLIVSVSGVSGVADEDAEFDLDLIDSIFRRDFAQITGEAARSLLNAVRAFRNKWSLSGTTRTVYKEDDSTPAWTSTVSTSGTATPITGDDPT